MPDTLGYHHSTLLVFTHGTAVLFSVVGLVGVHESKVRFILWFAIYYTIASIIVLHGQWVTPSAPPTSTTSSTVALTSSTSQALNNSSTSEPQSNTLLTFRWQVVRSHSADFCVAAISANPRAEEWLGPHNVSIDSTTLSECEDSVRSGMATGMVIFGAVHAYLLWNVISLAHWINTQGADFDADDDISYEAISTGESPFSPPVLGTPAYGNANVYSSSDVKNSSESKHIR